MQLQLRLHKILYIIKSTIHLLQLAYSNIMAVEQRLTGRICILKSDSLLVFLILQVEYHERY